MQIISGKFRGRKLLWPQSARPTSMRAKIAIFNILQSIIKQNDLVFWDVYAGSGAFGAELLSRGWAKAGIFTDSDPDAIKIIRRNLTDIGDSSSIVIKQAKMPGIESKYAPRADIIFVDAPYSQVKSLPKIIAAIANNMKLGAILIVESETEIPISPDLGLVLLTFRKYGRAHFMLLRKE